MDLVHPTKRLYQSTTLRTLIILFLVFFWGWLAYNHIQFHTPTRWLYGQPLDYFSASMRLTVVAFCFFALLSLEYFHRVRTDNVHEIATLYPRSMFRIFAGGFTVLTILVLVHLALLCIYALFLLNHLGIATPDITRNVLLSMVLNHGLTSIVGVLIGGMLSFIPRRTSAYMAFVLVVFATTSTANFLLMGVLPGSVRSYRYLDLISRFFNFSPPSLEDTVVSPFFGFSILPYRWFLLMFWLFIGSAVILFFTAKGRQTRQRLIALCFVVAALIPLYLYVQPSSKYIVGKTGSGREDALFYIEGASRAQVKPADFELSTLEMSLDIGLIISAEVRFQIQDPTPRQLDLTLYHGFTIDRVEDSTGNQLAFTRQDDYLTIERGESLDRSIHMAYHGTIDSYPVTIQGTQLPAGFPFWPMPGFQRIFLDGQGQAYFAPVYLEKPIEIDLTVRNRQPFHSNLKRVEENHFRSNSRSIALCSGLFRELVADGVRVVYAYADLPRNREDTIRAYVKQLGELNALPQETKTIFLFEGVKGPETLFKVDDSLGLRYFDGKLREAVERIAVPKRTSFYMDLLNYERDPDALIANLLDITARMKPDDYIQAPFLRWTPLFFESVHASGRLDLLDVAKTYCVSTEDTRDLETFINETLRENQLLD